MRNGFTIVELLISLIIVMVLATMIVVLINPPKQFAQARNTQRTADVNTILNAVGQNVADNKGTFSCSNGALPTSSTVMASSSGNYNIAPCLVPVYLPSLPYDPSATGTTWIATSSYDTGYAIVRSATTSRITVSAPSAELEKVISITR